MGKIPLNSVKYEISIPFLYSSAGFGLFFNHGGLGSLDLSEKGRIVANFTCQKQVRVLLPPLLLLLLLPLLLLLVR